MKTHFQFDEGSYEREDLPQIPTFIYQDVLKYLEEHHKGKYLTIPIHELRPIQRDYEIQKVVDKVCRLNRLKPNMPHKTFIVSSDCVIIDGHHTMKAWQVYSPWTEVEVLQLPYHKVEMKGAVEEALFNIKRGKL